MEELIQGITNDLLMSDVVTTRVEQTANEIIIDVDTIESDEHYHENISGIALTWLLDVIRLPRPKHYEKQTYIFYMKVS